MGGKTVDRAFEGQPEAVFEACRRAAANLGFSVLTASKDALTISFNTGRSFKTVGGQDLTASIFDQGGSCRVVVGGSLAKGGNLHGGAQFGAWGEKKTLSNKFLDEVGKVISSIQPTQTQQQQTQADQTFMQPVVESKSVSTADELLKLKTLLDAGLITQAEFDAQKNQMLGVVAPQPVQSQSDVATDVVTSPRDISDRVDDQQEEPPSDSPEAVTKEAPSPVGQPAPPPPVGFTGRTAPPSRGEEEVHDVEPTGTPDEELLDLEATTAVLPTNDGDDLQHGDEIEESIAVDEQSDLGAKQVDAIQHVDAEETIESVEGEDSSESSLTNSPDESDAQPAGGTESQPRLETVDKPVSDDQPDPLDGLIEDEPAELQQEIEDGVEPANDSDLQPPGPPQETTSEEDDGEQDPTPAPPQPVAPQSPSEEVTPQDKAQTSSPQRESRKLLVTLVAVLVIAVAFMGGLLLSRSGQETPATQSEQASASLTELDEIAATTQPKNEEDVIEPSVPSSPATTESRTESTLEETTQQSGVPALSSTTVPETAQQPETTSGPTDTFAPSLPWIVRSASGSDQGSTVIIASSAVDSWHHGNCRSYTSDSTVSDPDGVSKVEWLMIYVEGQIPTGTPDADCVSQTFELIDGTDQSGTWRVTYHVSPFIQCAKYNQAIKITDTLGNTTVHNIGGFWFGGSDPPSTCPADEQYERS
ncbi:MAG: SHOCT domain-containing protein [Actinobacteria bacterium]|nr:SHOCT domain-containing protein [Actinomycetota bacterium]